MNKSYQRNLLIILSILLAIVLGIYLLFLNFVNKIYIDEQGNYNKKNPHVNKKPELILLLGIDKRPKDHGRSDAIHLVSLNLEKNEIKTLSFPRDTYVSIPDHGENKINHSYAYGGSELAKKTIEKFICTSIDGYIEINMEGFKSIIDRLGGIEINIPFDFSFRGEDFKKGLKYIDGQQALNFVRMRKLDKEGDIGRLKRGQIVLKGIYEKIFSLSNMHLLPTLINDMGNYLKTDIPIGHFLDLYDNYKDKSKRIDGIHYEGKNAKINGADVYLVDEDERKKISHEIRKHLDLPQNKECEQENKDN